MSEPTATTLRLQGPLTPGSGDGVAALRRLEAAAVPVLAIAAIVLALACSRWGAGIGGDGVAYVVGARSLASGHGYSGIGPEGDVRPITIFGPLFPMILGGLALIGIDPLVGARLVNALLFGVNTTLIAAILRQCTGRRWPGVIGGLLFIFFPPNLGLHAAVQSEPVFLALLLLQVTFLIRAGVDDSQRWPFFAGMAAGLGYLARYAGLAFVGSGVVTLLCKRKLPWRRRVKAVLAFALTASAPIAAWMARNAALAGSAIDRWMEYEPANFALLAHLVDQFSFWLLPDRVPLVVRVGVLVVGGALAAWALTRTRHGSQDRGIGMGENVAADASLRVFIPAIALYPAQLLFSRLFLVPRISLDQRILAPLWLLTMLCLLVVTAGLHQRSSRRAASWIGGFVLAFAVSYLLRGSIRAIELQVDGQGFASRAWRTSPLINAMSLLPPDTPIYTNEVEAVVLLTGRRVYRLPTGCLPEDAMLVLEPGADCRTPAYQKWVDNMRRALVEDHAVLAIFDTYRDFPYYAPLVPELVEGLDILTSQGDGRLYVHDRAEWPDSPHW